MKVRETDEARVPHAERVGTADRGDAPLPVLVWFHGGSFVIGASSQPVYDGALLAAEQDVVVVSVQLPARRARLPRRPVVRRRRELRRARRDLRARVGARQHRRVRRRSRARRRVRRVGRRRARVARARVALGARAARRRDHPERRDVRDPRRDARRRRSLETLVKEAGRRASRASCATSPIDALIAAQSAAMCPLLGTVGMMPFHPMVDDDVLPAAPVDALAAGAAAGVALVVGTTADEMRLFVDSSAAPAPRDKVVRRVGALPRRRRARRPTTIVDDYEARARHRRHERDLARAVRRQRDAVPVPRGARRARAARPDVHVLLHVGAAPQVGACHGIDIPFPFGNFVDGWDAFVGLDDDGRALSARRCATRGPRSRATGDPGWPQYPRRRGLRPRRVNDAARAPAASDASCRSSGTRLVTSHSSIGAAARPSTRSTVSVVSASAPRATASKRCTVESASHGSSPLATTRRHASGRAGGRSR